MAHVVLIQSPMILNTRKSVFVVPQGDERSNPPTGILYIASYLVKHGFSVKVVDISPEGLTVEDLLETISVEQPMLVGISATTAGTRSAVKMAGAIKEKFPDIPICLGGTHINCDPDFFNRFPVFDFCVIGEGEKTALDSCKRIMNGDKVQGVLYGDPMEDLDSLPFPARELINPQNYLREECRKEGALPAATVLSSRGCPFKCSYCSIPVVKHKLRFRSPQNIVDEMESIYESCNGWYSFVDDNLTLNKKRTIELCDEIIRRDLKPRWCGMTRANTLDEEVTAKLAAAGCDDLFFGVESGNERIRNEVIKKNVSNLEIKNAIKLCKKYGIHTNIFLMAGFPTETMAEIEDTVNIGSMVGADMIGIHITIPFPGTELYRYAVSKGMISADYLDRFVTGTLCDDSVSFLEIWPLFVPDGLSLEDLVRAKKRAYRRFYLSPRWIFGRVGFWWAHPKRFSEDLKLLKVAPSVFMKGKTKSATS